MLEHGEDGGEEGFGEDEIELFEPDPNYEPTEEGSTKRIVYLFHFLFLFVVNLLYFCLLILRKEVLQYA